MVNLLFLEYVEVCFPLFENIQFLSVKQNRKPRSNVRRGLELRRSQGVN